VRDDSELPCFLSQLELLRISALKEVDQFCMLAQDGDIWVRVQAAVQADSPAGLKDKMIALLVRLEIEDQGRDLIIEEGFERPSGARELKLQPAFRFPANLGEQVMKRFHFGIPLSVRLTTLLGGYNRI